MALKTSKTSRKYQPTNYCNKTLEHVVVCCPAACLTKAAFPCGTGFIVNMRYDHCCCVTFPQIRARKRSLVFHWACYLYFLHQQQTRVLTRDVWRKGTTAALHLYYLLLSARRNILNFRHFINTVYWTDLQASGAAQRFQAVSGRSSRGSRQTGKTRGASSASRCAAAAHTGRPLQRCKGQRLQ